MKGKEWGQREGLFEIAFRKKRIAQKILSHGKRSRTDLFQGEGENKGKGVYLRGVREKKRYLFGLRGMQMIILGRSGKGAGQAFEKKKNKIMI